MKKAFNFPPLVPVPGIWAGKLLNNNNMQNKFGVYSIKGLISVHKSFYLAQSAVEKLIKKLPITELIKGNEGYGLDIRVIE